MERKTGRGKKEKPKINLWNSEGKRNKSNSLLVTIARVSS